MEKKHDVGQNFDFKKYLLKLIAYWYLFAISISIGLIYNHIENRFVVPTYGIHTTVHVKSDYNTPDAAAGGLQLFARSKNLETESGVLKSKMLAEKAIRKMNIHVSYFLYNKYRSDVEIYNNSPFEVSFDSTSNPYNYVKFFITILSENKIKLKNEKLEIEQEFTFGDSVHVKDLKIVISKNALKFDKSQIGKTYYFYHNDINAIVNNYASSLNVDVLNKTSTILWLWLVGSVPEKDADFLNNLVKTYVQQGLDEKNMIAKNTIKFIDDQLGIVTDSLMEAEDKLQYFKQNNSINLSEAGKGLLEKLQSMEMEEKIQKIRLNYYKYLLKDFESNKDIKAMMAPSVMGVDDPILLAQMQKMSEIIYQRELLNFNVTNDGKIPTTDAVDLEIKNLQISIVEHVKKSIEVAKVALEDIVSRMSNTEKQIYNLPVAERQMLNITRKFDLNDQIYTLLLERRTEAAITQASNTPDVKILDIAKPENAILKSPPPGGNRNQTLLIAIIIPILIIVIKEFFNTKIIDKSDIEKGTSIAIVGSISSNNKKSNIPVFTNPKSPISESFRTLRTNLQYLLIDRPSKVVMVSSTISGEGKTFTAINLASIIAMSSKKTLLMGMDLRKPKIFKDFNLTNDIGISTYLIGENSFDDVIIPTHIPHLSIALSGPVPPNPAELIESQRMKDFIEMAKNKFDYVVIDTPPVAIVTDAILLSVHADCFLYVMRQNYTNKNSIKLVDEIKITNNLKNINIVVNDVNMSVSYGLKYGYGYSYGYHYGYGYGYGQGQGYYDEDNLKPTTFQKIKYSAEKILQKIFS